MGMPDFVSNGHRLHYRERGRGPLLLILPGATASSAGHGGELAYFSRRYRAVALDFLGTGQSERLAFWPDDWWEQAASDAARLVEHLGYEECMVMGTSGGAAVALLLAIVHAERVRAVVADSVVEHLPAERWRMNLADRARRSEEQIRFWRRMHGDDWEQVVEADTDLLRRFASRGGDWFAGRLAKIRCPVLFTASLHDEMLANVGPQLCHMVEQVCDSRLYLTREGRHPLMWSRPGEFRRAASAFLDSATANDAPT